MRKFIDIVEDGPSIIHTSDGGSTFRGFGVQAELGGNEIGTFVSTRPGLGNGSKAVKWLKEYFGKLSVHDPGYPNENPESFAFWKRMTDLGLVDEMRCSSGKLIYGDGKWHLNWSDPEIRSIYGPGFTEYELRD